MIPALLPSATPIADASAQALAEMLATVPDGRQGAIAAFYDPAGNAKASFAWRTEDGRWTLGAEVERHHDGGWAGQAAVRFTW